MITTAAKVERIKCMCGETVCARCRHRMSACQASPDARLRYCPACGHPLIAKVLNATTPGAGEDRGPT